MRSSVSRTCATRMVNDCGALWHDCDSLNGFASFLQQVAPDLLVPGAGGEFRAAERRGLALSGRATSVFHERCAMTREAGRGERTGDEGSWAHSTLCSYLAGWTAWLKDADASSYK